MSVGDVTLNVSAILAIMALAVSLLRLLGRKIDPRVPRVLGVLAGIAALASLAFLFNIFLSTDLSFQIVHQYSSEDMPTLYKLSGAWAGKAGSMVFWTSTILIAWMVEELRWWRRTRRGDEPREDAPERDVPEPKESRRKERAKQRRTLASKQASSRSLETGSCIRVPFALPFPRSRSRTCGMLVIRQSRLAPSFRWKRSSHGRFCRCS